MKKTPSNPNHQSNKTPLSCGGSENPSPFSSGSFSSVTGKEITPTAAVESRFVSAPQPVYEYISSRGVRVRLMQSPQETANKWHRVLTDPLRCTLVAASPDAKAVAGKRGPGRGGKKQAVRPLGSE